MLNVAFCYARAGGSRGRALDAPARIAYARAAMKNVPANLNDDQVLTFRQWIALNNISARTGRRIISAPGGPIVTRLSPRRFGITVANNRAWQQSRERSPHKRALS